MAFIEFAAADAAGAAAQGESWLRARASAASAATTTSSRVPSTLFRRVIRLAPVCGDQPRPRRNFDPAEGRHGRAGWIAPEPSRSPPSNHMDARVPVRAPDRRTMVVL